MNLNCAILHADGEIVRRLEEYIGKVPFLSLRGTYDSPLEALRDYYEVKVEVYFIGICAAGEGGIGGMDFSRMLSLPTRVIFVADTGRYAAECFRLDALDYLTGSFGFSVFFQSVSKAARWFALQLAPAAGGEKKPVADLPQAFRPVVCPYYMKVREKPVPSRRLSSSLCPSCLNLVRKKVPPILEKGGTDSIKRWHLFSE